MKLLDTTQANEASGGIDDITWGLVYFPYQVDPLNPVQEAPAPEPQP